MHHDDLLHAIGRTPLVELRRLSPRPGIRLFAKLEGMNPTGSVKDRIVREMVLGAEREGRIRPGDCLVEASTGNTGIALAMVGRARGYRVHVVMPENVYHEIPEMVAAYGATVHTVPASEGVRGAMDAARRMAERKGWAMLDQFSSPYNTLAHYETTGREILEDLPHVDVLVAGLGTGGTLMGAGRRLKEANPRCKVIAVEPHPGYQVQGLKSLADGFIPPILDFSLLDGRILVRSWHAFHAAKVIMQREGIFAGVSSGAALHAALKYLRRVESGNVVLIFADSGWKYLDTNLWMADWHAIEGESEDLDEVLWW
jgi:cysteine synthase B